MKLIFSPDDYDKYSKGYYWQEYRNWKTSQLFETVEEAERAKEENKLRWDK